MVVVLNHFLTAHSCNKKILKAEREKKKVKTNRHTRRFKQNFFLDVDRFGCCLHSFFLPSRRSVLFVSREETRNKKKNK